MILLIIIYLISLLLKNSLLYPTMLRSTREIRAVYTRDNKPQLTLAEAYIRGEKNHLYECGLHKMRTAGINGSLVKKVISRQCSARLSAMKVWYITETEHVRACTAIVCSFSKPQKTYKCIYMNTFMSQLSRSLNKPSPKLLGQDKSQL